MHLVKIREVSNKSVEHFGYGLLVLVVATFVHSSNQYLAGFGLVEGRGFFNGGIVFCCVSTIGH